MIASWAECGPTAPGRWRRAATAFALAGSLGLGVPCLAAGGTAQQALQTELTNVRRELAALRAHPAPTVLANPGFESQQLNTPGGWHVQPGATGAVQFDGQTAFEGKQSIHLAVRDQGTQAGSVVALRSAPFQLPATRRVAVTAWMRVNPATPAPPVWLVLEGKYKGQPFSHHVEVSGAAQEKGLPPLSGEWSPVTLQLDELPTDGGITDLVVGVDLRGQGELWVDSIQLTDMWLNDEEQRALMAQIETANGHLAAGDYPQAQQIIATTLPEMLSRYAAAEYLVPSLSQAAPALVAAAQDAAQSQITVGRAVRPGTVENSAVAHAATDTTEGEQPITPINEEESATTVATAAGSEVNSSASVAANHPTVLAPSANATSARAFVPNGSVGPSNAATPAIASRVPAVQTTVPATTPTTANGLIASGATAVTETDEDPAWWKFWKADDANSRRQAPRTMPGTYSPRPQRSSVNNAAVASSTTAGDETVSAPQSALQRIRQRFQRDENVSAGEVAASDTADADQGGFFQRLRLPFGKRETSQVAATTPSDNERRFALIGSGSEATAEAQAPVVTPSTTPATRDPFNVASSVAPVQGVQPATAQQEEPKESRFAALRRLFRTDDESSTVTK